MKKTKQKTKLTSENLLSANHERASKITSIRSHFQKRWIPNNTAEKYLKSEGTFMYK